MKNKLKHFCSIIIMCWQVVGFSDDNLVLECRVRPSKDSFLLSCRATNNSPKDVNVEKKLLHRDNRFKIHLMGDPHRKWSTFGAPAGMPPDETTIEPGITRQWVTTNRQIQSLEYIYGNSGYFLIQWTLNHMDSPQKILLGFEGSEKEIQKPVISAQSKRADVYLGFVCKADEPLDLVFLAMNGKSNAVIIEKPLTRNSLIIATSPGIEYIRELVIPDSPSEQVIVEPAEVGEWRLPWKTVLDLIPDEDLKTIKAASGDLDLVWKVGDYQSDPLPISLADIESIEGEK